jgi:hypothetical protein
MPHAPTPWVGLAALAAMFLIPFLPDWLFEGPRTVRHRPRRHVCGDCHAPWTSDHACTPAVDAAHPPLHAQLRRLAPPADLEGRQRTRIARTDVDAHATSVHRDGVAKETGRPRRRPDRAILGRSQRPPATMRDKTS